MTSLSDRLGAGVYFNPLVNMPLGVSSGKYSAIDHSVNIKQT